MATLEEHRAWVARLEARLGSGTASQKHGQDEVAYSSPEQLIRALEYHQSRVSELESAAATSSGSSAGSRYYRAYLSSRGY